MKILLILMMFLWSSCCLGHDGFVRRPATTKPTTSPTLEEQGLEPIFLFQSQRSQEVNRLLKLKERWVNLLSDEEVRFYHLAWERYKYRTVKNLLLVTDGDGLVYTPTKPTREKPEGGWDLVGEIRRKNWFKRKILPTLKGLWDHTVTGGPVHIVLSLFGF
jgi:hypothetical protein